MAKFKIEFKHILQAIPAAFTVVRESMKLWDNKNKCCKKCRSWSKAGASDRKCTNSRFRAVVNIYNFDERRVKYYVERLDAIVTHETFCCCFFKK